MDLGVVQTPELGSLGFGVSAVAVGTKGEHAFFCSVSFFVAPGNAKHNVKNLGIQHLFECLGFHDIGVVVAAVGEWTDTCCQAFWIGVHQQLHAAMGHHAVAVDVHSLELPAGVYVQQGKKAAVPGRRPCASGAA